MKLFRKYTAGTLLLVLVLLTAACGRSDSNTNNGNPMGQSMAPQLVPTMDPPTIRRMVQPTEPPMAP